MNKKNHSIDFIFVLLLFFIFVVMSVVLAVLGSNVYNSISNRQENNNTMRTALSYVANKIQTATAVTDKVTIENKDGKEILVINSCDESSEYSTLIFYKDGYIREATILKGSEYNLDFGNNLLKAEDFRFELSWDKQTVAIFVTNENGKTESLTVNTYNIK